MIEIKNFVGLRKIIETDYPTYSGKILELYFKQKFAESYQFRAIGSWWETKGNQNEIDIVALGLEKNKAVVAEVKRQRKNFKPSLMLLLSESCRPDVPVPPKQNIYLVPVAAVHFTTWKRLLPVLRQPLHI